MGGLADKKGVAPFLTALNGSLLKNRIIMMKKKTENKYTFVKQLLVLPLLAILVMGLSNKEVKTEIVSTDNQVEILNAEKVIKGKVTDPNGDPVSGSSMIVKGKTIGTITNAEGNYEINLDEENETLVFVMVGFEKQEISVDGKTEMNVKLTVENQAKKDEIKVSGYGTQNDTENKKYKYEVKGKVSNEQDEPIPGAAILLKGKTIGTVTNMQGEYELGMNEKNEILVFSMVGYEVKEVPANEKKKINVKLISNKNPNKPKP